MGFELLSDAFLCLGKKYHPYSDQNKMDPISLLVSNSSNSSLDMNVAMRLFIAGKIRKSIRDIQFKQQNASDKMSLESGNECDFSDQVEDLVVAIENVTAAAGTIHYAKGIQREHDFLLEREGLMRLRIVL
jgi:hypothetical protein